MFQEERVDFKFEWEHLGNLALGRPNLGPTTHIALYRLMQFTLRDALIRHGGVELANRVFFDAGRNAGAAIYKHLLNAPKDMGELVRSLQRSFEELGGGIIRVEEADLEKNHFVLTVAEDLDCSGLPLMDEAICTYDEGFIAGILEAHLGIPFRVREVDCWCTGDRVCRFEAVPRDPTAT
ncbi:MAG: 4-vinyl reductase [Candidatus Hydrogenedentes bacterium]|nr:4-vinyl reductase [Candidatus Hydrogenedentota bacterium]